MNVPQDAMSSETSSGGVIVCKNRSSTQGIRSSFSNNSHMVFYPSLLIESSFSPPSSPTSIQNQMRLLEQQSDPQTTYNNVIMSTFASHAGPVRHHHHHLKGVHTSRGPISSAVKISSKNYRTSSPIGSPSSPSSTAVHHINPAGVVIQHHPRGRHGGIPRNLAKPLERTNSAPLPLGHPMLQDWMTASIAASQAAVASTQVGQTSSSPGSGTGSPSSGVILDPVAQRNLLKQKIRQTVLTRASSKQQLQRLSLEEETEAAIAQEMKESEVSRYHATPTKLRMRQYFQEVMSAKTSSHDSNTSGAVDLSSRKRRESSRDSTPESGIASYDHQDASNVSQQQVLQSSHLPLNIHPLPTPLFHGSLMETSSSPPRHLHGIPVIDPTASSSASSSASSNASASMYQQILVQQHQQLQLLQQQKGQHDSSVSILGYHPGIPGAAVALLPEVNQYPQVLPHSRLAFYDNTSGGLSRPLSRAVSSPIVFLGNIDSSSPHGSNSNIAEPTAQHSPPISGMRRLNFTTGVVHDNLMLKHQSIYAENHNHPEHAGRRQEDIN